MIQLIVATLNQGKIREYRALLADLPIQVTWLDAEGITDEVEETGSTFAENAALKAQLEKITAALQQAGISLN